MSRLLTSLKTFMPPFPFPSSTTDSFNVIIATDTQWPGAVQDLTVRGGTGGDATTFDGLEAALEAGSGVACTVTLPAGFAAPFHG